MDIYSNIYIYIYIYTHRPLTLISIGRVLYITQTKKSEDQSDEEGFHDRASNLRALTASESKVRILPRNHSRLSLYCGGTVPVRWISMEPYRHPAYSSLVW